MLAALASGCVAFPDTSEEAINAALRRDPVVVPCISTIAHLEAQLGPPLGEVRHGDARVLSWLLPAPVVRSIDVLVDASGTVVDVHRAPEDGREWTPVDRCR